MVNNARERAEKLRDRSSTAATQRPATKDSAGQGIGLDWVVLRAVRENEEMMVQRVRYASNPPVQGEVVTTGDFITAYPPPGVRWDAYTPFVFELKNAATALPINFNPTTDEARALFDAAIAVETLGTLFYPFRLMANAGHYELIFQFWPNPNIEFHDEQQATSEGSSA